MAARQPEEMAIAAEAEIAHQQTIHDADAKYDEKYGSEGHVAVASTNGSEKAHEDANWVFPTEDERSGPNKLRRVSDKIPWYAYLIGVIEMVERFSYYGTTAVFTNFIQRPLPPGSKTGKSGKNGTPGALGRGLQTANGLITFNQFWVYVVPLAGAYFADTRWGRYRTVCYAVAVASVGHVLITVSAIPGVIEKQNAATGVFILALIIMGIGTGGFKANVSPMVAEQYKVVNQRVETLKSGERIIIDPAVTQARIYNYFYLLINIGALVGSIGMTYAEKYVGFWLSFLLPTVCFFLCPIILWFGRHQYASEAPQGSVVADALKVLRISLRGTWSFNPMRMWRNWGAPDFWERAKPSYIAANGGDPASVPFDDVFVDEVMRAIKASQVFLFYPFYWIAYNQLNNNMTAQAATMVTNGVPNDVINNLDPFALIILIPICDYWIYPFMQRIGLPFTPIKRIFAGFMTGAAAMVWSAVVQYYIYQRSPCGYQANSPDCSGPAPLSVWIQTGGYVLIAISEIFASITGLEYAFQKAPKSMRSVVMSIFLFQSAISSAINEALNPLAADPLLVWNYGSAAIISGVAGIAFWICFKHLDQQDDELNDITARREEVGTVENHHAVGIVSEKHGLA